MVPLSATVTFDVQKVRVQWLLAYAQSLPLLEMRFELPFEWTVVCSCEVRRLVSQLYLIVLLNRIDLALRNNSISEHRVEMTAREHFVFANELKVFFYYAELGPIKVVLSVVPLDLDHWPVRM
jgi:hypothetical protein